MKLAGNISSECSALRPKMEPTDDERLARERKWESARQKLQERLGALGLVVERDYRFHGEDWSVALDRIGVELRNENLITTDFLLACRLTLSESEESRWGAIVAVRDSTRINGMRSIVEISGGLFTVINSNSHFGNLAMAAVGCGIVPARV